MDQTAFEEVVERLKTVNEVIEGLDPSIRAQAFSALEPYVTESPAKAPSGKGRDEKEEESDALPSGLEEFFEKHGSDKEADNAHAAAAWWYREYGKSPFTFDDLRQIAQDAEVHISDRLDNVIGSGRRDGKPLYRRVERGSYRPTANGEKFLKATYEVTKGRKNPPGNDEPS